MKRILVIDDEPAVIEAMKDVLSGIGYDTTVCGSAVEGQREALSADYDLIMVDLMMPDRNGAEVTRAILKEKPESTILVITGHPHDPLAGEALQAGAKSLVAKPFEIGKVMDFLRE